MIDAPALYPTWLFILYGGISLCMCGVSLVSVGFAIARRWSAARRFGRISFLGALALVFAALPLIFVLLLLGVGHRASTESKATLLARGISDTINLMVIIFPTLVIGALTWPIGAFVERRRARNAS